ncbi:hypothetical protein ACQ4N7_01120 [Nodosilinea sp. AN01ver1]|uniref:hypothetical protein n=1 Tax=Nodosilinea sp. AN01ver1 TaxID=3423362 RepID=UPI003D321FB8
MEPLPKSPLGQRLCELFSYRWNWLEASLEDSATTTKWSTNSKYPIKPRSLWTRYQDASQVIGVRFGSNTKYGLIDIDANSPYIDQLDLVREALETIGIVRTITIRSSWSGGVHLYCPLPKAYPTFSVACALTMALEAQGIHIAGGQCEVFPNMKAYTKFWLGEFSNYNGHRLPLQPAAGSCILTDDCQPMNGAYDLARFFALWDNALLHQDRDAFEQALVVARRNRRRRQRATGPVESWRNDLEGVIAEGWTGAGQTNQLLKEFACYGRVFEGLSGVELAEYVERIATTRPGYERWCSHQHEIWRRACVWARAAENYYWPLGSEPLRERRSLVDVAQERASDARARIAEAIRSVRFAGLSIRELVSSLCTYARCSATTLYKNRDLWHPEQVTECDRTSEPVTAQPEGDRASMSAILAQVRESLESADLAPVTRLWGENETCSLISSDLKNLSPGGKEGGAGGREGLSTGGSYA